MTEIKLGEKTNYQYDNPDIKILDSVDNPHPDL
ncbi:MAG: hypothetical protein ACI9IL_000342, partial [Rickettsiales bacterium]